jgi:hypothetical protein
MLGVDVAAKNLASHLRYFGPLLGLRITAGHGG